MFGNPIVSGLGNLIREQIQSPNFVTGVSGWQIRRDGTAEFLDLIARGSLDVGGIPGVWIGPRDDPDFPSDLFDESTLYVGAIVFYSTATEYQYIAIRSLGTGGSMEIGHVEGGTVYKAFSVKLSVGVIPDLAGITNFAENRYVNDSVVNFDSANADLQFASVSASRGLKDHVFSAVNGAAIGGETADQTTTATFDWQAGRAYRIDFGGLMFGSVANQGLVNLRATNAAGALWRQFRFTLPAGGPAAVECNGSGYVRRLLASGDLNNVPVCLTLTASAGTVTRAGGGTFPRFVKVYDVGTDTDYPDAFNI
jgi:hypothetical protein